MLFRLRRVPLGLLLLCGLLSGCGSKVLASAIGTGPHLNAPPGEPPRAVRIHMYQLASLPAALLSAACDDLRGERPEVLGENNILSASFPSVIPQKKGRSFVIERDKEKGAKWMLVVPNFSQCEEESERWALFPLDNRSQSVYFAMNGFEIVLHKKQQGYTSSTASQLRKKR